MSSFLFSESKISENLREVETAVKRAFKSHCHLICFPECALTGLPTEDYKRDYFLATEIPGRIIRKISIIARKYHIFIAIGLLEKDRRKIYDSAVLFNDMGEIILKYRRINHQWHSHEVSKDLYTEGKSLNTCLTPFGKIGFAICGDIFDDRVIKMIKNAKPDFLIIPMSRSFGGGCLNKKDWEKREKFAYACQIARIGVVSLLVNAFEPGPNGSFGGALIIAHDGKIIAETKIGIPSYLYKMLPAYSL
ncbi:MAG: carbon-nitrogen hydrolase family protein [bacterium]